MARKGAGRRQALLEDADFRRWYENLARGALTTADNYMRVLGLALERMGLTPAEFAGLESKERDDRMADFLQRMLDEGKAASYAAVVKKAAVSWLEHNGLKFTRKIKVPSPARSPSGRSLRIPLLEELRRVLNVADARARTAIGLIAFAGLRLQVLGTYRGNHGLRVRDVVDARLEEDLLVFEKLPARIEVSGRLSKTKLPYFTFLGPEGGEYLAAYMRERAEGGEVLTPDSPVVTPKTATKPFIRTINIGDLIRRPMRKAGVSEPPYIWRSFFSSQAMLAESKGLSKDWKEFFMGHKGGIAEVYSLQKQLPPDTVEAMRDGYGHALKFLETTPRRPREDPTGRLIRLILRTAGFGEEELEELDLEGMTDEEIVALLDRGPGPQLATNGSGPRQRIVDLEELPAALQTGWVYRDSLSDGRVVVELDVRP